MIILIEINLYYSIEYDFNIYIKNVDGTKSV